MAFLAWLGAGILTVGLFFGGIVLFGLFVAQKQVADIIALALGICLLAGTAFLYYDTHSFIARAIATEGVVVGYASHTDDEGVYYNPMVEFKTKDGEAIRFEDSYFSNLFKGDTVKIYYDPANPSHARINKWLVLWSWPVVTFSLSIPALVIATRRLLKWHRP